MMAVMISTPSDCHQNHLLALEVPCRRARHFSLIEYDLGEVAQPRPPGSAITPLSSHTDAPKAAIIPS